MSTFPIVGYIALGLIPLGFVWIFSSIGKNVEIENGQEVEECCKAAAKEESTSSFVVLNKTTYRKIKDTWYQVTPSGGLMILNHLENYQKIVQLLEEKAKEQVC